MKPGQTFKTFISAVLLGAVSLFPYAATAETVPNDPLFFEQWYLEAIGMTDAWDFAKGSPTVVVAVLDSGVDTSHPDLRDRIWTNPGEIPGNGIDDDGNGYVDDAHGWDFVENDASPDPEAEPESQVSGANHGTLVAGIIAAAGNNGEGVSGINWNARVMPLRVLDSGGSGRTTSVVEAIRYAVAKGAKIINISFTGSGYSQSLAAAIREAHAAGVLVVAAAGNEGDTERGGDLNVYPSYPSCYRGENGQSIVLGVASLDRHALKSSFSSYGSDCVALSAPGESFFTTQTYRPGIARFREPYGDGWFGSSLSAPVVSGAAALLSSMAPDLDGDALRAFLTSTARNIDAENGEFAGQLGGGQIDVAAAVMAVQRYTLGLEPVPETEEASGPTGRLIKLASSSAVYYLGADGQRYVFPNAKTYQTWYAGTPVIRTVGDEEMAAIPLGGNVTYRPGTRMVKIQSDPKIYAVSRGGVLRHVVSESVAEAVFGPDWNTQVDDIPVAFFVNYRIGPPIESVFDYDPEAERERTGTIDRDKSLLPS